MICDCGSHAWLRLSKGYVTILDVSDADKVTEECHTSFSAGKPYARLGSGAFLHRVLCGVSSGVVDHINHDPLDNRRANLRPCSNAQNLRNMRPRVGTASVFKGVSRNGERWRASIKPPGSKNSRKIGSFWTEEEAARAYDDAAVRLFGEYAFTNSMAGLLSSRPHTA